MTGTNASIDGSRIVIALGRTARPEPRFETCAQSSASGTPSRRCLRPTYRSRDHPRQYTDPGFPDTEDCRPPARERCISRNAASLSGKNCRPCWHRITSNDESGRSMAIALPSTQTSSAPDGGGSVRATASIPALKSSPVTRPVDPTCGPARRATNPVPQARSRTRSPMRSAATATSPGAGPSCSAPRAVHATRQHCR